MHCMPSTCLFTVCVNSSVQYWLRLITELIIFIDFIEYTVVSRDSSRITDTCNPRIGFEYGGLKNGM